MWSPTYLSAIGVYCIYGVLREGLASQTQRCSCSVCVRWYSWPCRGPRSRPVWLWSGQRAALRHTECASLHLIRHLLQGGREFSQCVYVLLCEYLLSVVFLASTHWGHAHGELSRGYNIYRIIWIRLKVNWLHFVNKVHNDKGKDGDSTLHPMWDFSLNDQHNTQWFR